MDEQTLFAEALDRTDPQSRAAFLDQACQGNAALRERIERLLAQHEHAGAFLESPQAPLGATVDEPSTERSGTMIGPYKLLEEIGEGGMGTVWMAQQSEPIKRLVAIKLIKPGMDSKQVLARFEAERQALALMDHPNIAKVFDAGASCLLPNADARPYFVMELVKGVPITKYCDEHQLPPRQRLELFIPVCQAIQHAHQKGIIHRDIKPSNVLVAIYDDRPVPKIIDFGVAKATGPQLTEATLHTNFGAVVGTIEYMSPEQASFNQLDVDTRSDIYSLGVLLYELLAGTPPFTTKELAKVGMMEMLRVIREQEPSKPSTKLSSSDALPTLSANRGTEPARLTKLVRGELDWIVMKALEKDRSRRYETANGFAMDVQRYLADEAVQACPPSTSYRLRKFVRRNKATLATGALVFMVLMAALVVLAVSNVLVTRERNAKDKALVEKVQALGDAQHQEGLAKEQTVLAKRRLYAAQLNLAMQAWRAGELPRVLELLEGQRPKGDEVDLRGFEWFYLWRLCNGGSVQLNGHTNAVLSVSFSRDGKTLASASWDRTVRLWDVATGRERMTLRGHKKGPFEGPWDVAFSPDGTLLASGGKECNEVIVWNATTGKPLYTIPMWANRLAFSADGRTLLSSDLESTRLWDVANGKQRAVFPEPGMMIGMLPDGKSIATLANQFGENSEVRIWDAESGVRRLTIPMPSGQTAALSADGTQMATAAAYSVLVWDTATGKQLFARNVHCASHALDFSRDGKMLAAGLDDRRVVVWNLESGDLVGEHVHRDPVWGVAFSPDSKLIASSTVAGVIKLWDRTPPQEATTIANVPATMVAPGSPVRCVRFSPDGKTLLIGNKDLTKVIDVAAGKEVALLPVRSVIAISDDASVMAAQATDVEYDLWDISADRKLGTISLSRDLSRTPRLKLSRDGKALASHYVWGGNNQVKLWDVATQQSRTLNLQPPRSNRLSAMCVDFSPDGKLLAAGFQFQWVTVWDVATSEVKLQFSQPPAMMTVHSVAFSPNGKALAVGTNIGAVTLWDVETGKQIVAFRGHTTMVHALAFSPDGQTLATGSADRTVRLWDVLTGQERGTLKGHTGAIMDLSFSPDGYTLVTASFDGTVRLWQGATDAEALAPRSVASQRAAAATLTLPPGALELTVAGLREGVRRWPDSAELHRQLGKMLQGQGELAQAESSFQDVVRLKPDDDVALVELAKVFREQQKFAEAETALRELIRLKPTHVQAHDTLGWTLQSQRKFSEMEAAFRDLLRLKPDYAGGHHGLGRALLGQKKSGDAIAPLREAVRLGSKDHWVFDALGWALVEQKQPAEAEAAFHEVIRLKPDFANGYYGLGRALLDQKKFADAETALREVLRLNPTHPRAGNLLTQALVGQGKLGEAEELKEKLGQKKQGSEKKEKR